MNIEELNIKILIKVIKYREVNKSMIVIKYKFIGMLFQVTLIKVNDNIKVTLSLVFNTNK